MLLLLPAQPVGGVDVLRALRLGLEPRLDRLAQLGVAPQAQREADLREAELVAFEQLAQRAQALQLGRPVEPVAGRERGGSTSPLRST